MPAGPDFWATIPAAGAGRRLGAELPKQYLRLNGRSMIDHALSPFVNHAAITGIIVALSPEDAHWQTTQFAGHPKITTVSGGAERCHSVLNALRALSGRAAADDYVLVHDAARPCLREADIDRLLAAAGHADGAILALPARDTMKRTDEQNEVVETVDRNRLWHALTPQMFRIGQLERAVDDAIAGGELVTDEAGAMERAGGRPLLVAGHPHNIKVTFADDLVLAERLLTIREEQECA